MKPLRSKKNLRYFAAAALSAFTFYASPVQAATVYALTNAGSLLTFDHLTPGVLTNNVPVTNLGSYKLLAIDVRPTVQDSPSQPGVGSLWAIGRAGTDFQLFVLDPLTGAATAIGSPIAAGINSAPANTEWGFDFDPSEDRVRLVNSSAADNYRLNPNNGELIFEDPKLAYVTGDPNFGNAPKIDGVAYTTAAFGEAATIYYIDPKLDILATSAAPNEGSLKTVGTLNMGAGQPNGFDISGELALLSDPTADGSSLYSVDLATGAATLVGAFPAGTNVRGLAISSTDGGPTPTPTPTGGPTPTPTPTGPTPTPTPTQPGTGKLDTTRPFVRVLKAKKLVTTANRFTLKIRAYDNSGKVAVSFRSKKDKKSASFKLIRSSTNLYTAKVRRLKHGNNPVVVRAVDPAGNQTRVRVVIRREFQNQTACL